MPISQREYGRRYQAIRKLMTKDKLDCLVIIGRADDFNRGNIRYVSGSGRGGCCIFPLEGRPVFLTGPGQAASPKAGKSFEALDLLDLRETTDEALQAGKELARFNKGNNIGVVGMNCISVPLYLCLKKLFGKKMLDASVIFEQARAVKSDEEIKKMRQAAAVADTVFDRLMAKIQPGMSDYQVYSLVKGTIYEHGCDYSFDLIDAGGRRMNMTFWPTGDKLKANSTLFMEITPAFEGYYAQLPVTLPVGGYPPQLRRMVATWKKANEKVQPLLRPGTKVPDIYRCLVDAVKEDGFISPLRPGHAIGLDALDFWSITETSLVVLKAGMTLAVHPSIMKGLAGDACGMGYTYLITEAGPERFSRVELGKLI
ncbi:MAG: Xaa-Pro peptidase family protein [Dehalococcoidales bacterium]|jgi:Xaa-Pro aminopeptidase